MTTIFQKDDFNTGLFECFNDCPSCLESVFCCYCFVSQEYNMLDQRQRSVNWMMCGMMMCCDAFLTMGASLIIGNVITRSKLRNVFRMTGVNAIADCLASVCCLHCTISQTYREMSLRRQWPGGICVEQEFRDPRLQAPSNPSMGEQQPQQAIALQVGAYPTYGNQMSPNHNGAYPQQYPQPQQTGAYGQPPPQGPNFYGAPPPPAGGYGAPPPPAGYGAPPPAGGYGSPQTLGYGPAGTSPAILGYGQQGPPPPAGYGPPPPAGYGQAPPPAGYGPPPPAGYGAPPPAPNGYGHPSLEPPRSKMLS